MSCGSSPGHSSPARARYLSISRSIFHLQKQGRLDPRSCSCKAKHDFGQKEDLRQVRTGTLKGGHWTDFQSGKSDQIKYLHISHTQTGAPFI